MTARISFDFTGTTALITGGTSGIGHATAVLFRDAGAEVAITGTQPTVTDYGVDLSETSWHDLGVHPAPNRKQTARKAAATRKRTGAAKKAARKGAATRKRTGVAKSAARKAAATRARKKR